MQITNTKSQNFTGTFRIRPADIKAKTEIPQLFTQGRQIFNDIIEKGDEVIVLRDNYDKRVVKYLQENNLKDIEYYPTINTKSGLDDEQPEGLLKLIKDKTTKVITDIQEIIKVSKTQKRTPKPIKAPKAELELKNVTNALRLNIENPKITNTSSVTKIRDEEKRRTLELISATKGTTYVYLKPDSLCEDSRKCIIDGKGNIVKDFKTPDEIHKFLKQFRELKQAKVNILSNK